jgi:AAA+ superfamily predicted ATPase
METMFTLAMPETPHQALLSFSWEMEYQWLAQVIASAKDPELAGSHLPEPPVWDGQAAEWTTFIQKHQLNPEERMLVLLGLCQYLRPDMMQMLLEPENGFRLVQCNKTGQLLPTGETFLRLLAGPKVTTDQAIRTRLEAHRYFATEHLFYQKGVFNFGEINEGMAPHFGVLKISPNYRDLFLYNRHTKPRFSAEFPAHLLESPFSWDDLILNESTSSRLDAVKVYLANESTLRNEWGMDRQLRQGYRCLFHGPSGTGKTLAATLLGKLLGREVYRVDLSSIVSKYIGETSKNLNALFNTAEDKNWVLFFDEGDALFGKRIDTAQSEDKNTHFANQDTAFLLQRIENYRGLVVVASNLKKNMDQAFMRRFQSVILFDIQDETRRLEIWKRHLPQICPLEPHVNLQAIAKQHHLSAASIVDACNRLAVMALQKGNTSISAADLDFCIREEIYK